MARKIYISSTYGDLSTYRDKLADTIRFLGEYFELVRIMEYMMPGAPNPILTECLLDVEKAEIYILIFGKRYGSIEPNSRLSYTENEYRHARTKGKIIIALLADEDAFDFKGIQIDNQPAFNRFKGEVQGDNLTFIKGFTNPDHMATQLLLALYPHAEKKWEVRDETKYYCNRENQCLNFTTFKKREKLNVFTLICKKYDQAEHFHHRMAKAEFGLRDEHVKKALHASDITAVYHSYDKHKLLMIRHMLINYIDKHQDTPETVRECVEHYKQKNRDNIYIEVKLSKEDTESKVLIHSLINFLNELNYECQQVKITIFFILTFEFSNNEAAAQEIVECIDGKTNFQIWRLGVLNKISEDHVKKWLKDYIADRDDKLLDKVLSKYYAKKGIDSYPMYDLLPMLNPIVKRVIALK